MRYSINLTHIATDIPTVVPISKDAYHNIVWPHPTDDVADTTLTNILGTDWDKDFFYDGCTLDNRFDRDSNKGEK